MVIEQTFLNQYGYDLLKKISERDKQAFELFYKHYYKGLYITAFKYTKDQEQSQEIVNDIFLKIWNNASTLKIDRSLDGYLYRAVANTSINYINKEKRKSEKLEEFIQDFDESEGIDDSVEQLEKRLALIEAALEQLPPQCKKVMLMSKFEKYKQQEIADKLNISIKTVKNHLTYGYKKIENFLIDNNAFIFLLIFCLYRIGLLNISLS
jgi:RNA polymerase sigma-70 factor (family 1)